MPASLPSFPRPENFAHRKQAVHYRPKQGSEPARTREKAAPRLICLRRTTRPAHQPHAPENRLGQIKADALISSWDGSLCSGDFPMSPMRIANAGAGAIHSDQWRSSGQLRVMVFNRLCAPDRQLGCCVGWNTGGDCQRCHRASPTSICCAPLDRVDGSFRGN